MSIAFPSTTFVLMHFTYSIFLSLPSALITLVVNSGFTPSSIASSSSIFLAGMCSTSLLYSIFDDFAPIFSAALAESIATFPPPIITTSPKLGIKLFLLYAFKK